MKTSTSPKSKRCHRIGQKEPKSEQNLFHPLVGQMIGLLFLLLLPTISLQGQTVTKIIVEKPGTLAEQIAATTPPIVALKVEGEINGKDIAELRRLCGGAFDTGKLQEGGTLTYLDLKKAKFVADEEKYCFLNDAIPNPEKIGKKMFTNCTSLKTIVLPKGVTLIDEAAFEGCSQLYKIGYTDEITSIGWEAFKNCSALAFASFSDQLTEIRGGAFRGCTSLRGFIFPPSVKDIGSNAFEASGLVFASLPEAAVDLGNQIFKDCRSLKAVRMVGSLGSIPMGMFSGCSSLIDVTLPEETPFISGSAFEGCSSLMELTLPKSYSYIQGYAFWGCSSLRSITALCPESAVIAFSAFESKYLANITLKAPKDLLDSYKENDPWASVTLVALEDIRPIDKVCLEDDFSAYSAQISEWKGNELWTSDHGAYIYAVDENGHNLLKLGDNEGSGKIISKALDLSPTGGTFRIRLSADGWNDFHSSLLVEAKDKQGNVLSSHLLSIPNPQMGANPKVFDWEMSGGSQETYIHLSTSDKGRIALISNIKVYFTTEPQPIYWTDTPAIDFGRVAVNQEAEDQQIFLFAKNIKTAPKAKIVSRHPGIFAVDSELSTMDGKMIVMLNSDKPGQYDAYLQISYEDVNVLSIPLKAIVQNPDNVFDLDDTNPVSEINEDFNAEARLPKNWKTVALVGSRSWMMRTTGAGGNRYPAIDALGNVSGTVHSLLILPAVAYSQEQFKDKELAFDCASVKTNGAKLSLVKVHKNGKIDLLQEYTQQTDKEWNEQTFDLGKIGAAEGSLFLAFEYIGQTPTASTIYRIDNVKIRLKNSLQDSSLQKDLSTAISKEGVFVQNLSPGVRINLYNTNGTVERLLQAKDADEFIPLNKGSYILVVSGYSPVKILIP